MMKQTTAIARFSPGRPTRFAALALLFLLAVSCRARPILVRPALESEGAAYVYLAALPQEAKRLSFRLSSLSALKEDGEAVPLALSVREVRGGEAGRERLLGSGSLPPGRYAGLSVRVEKAVLSGEAGEASLLVPEEPQEITVSFPIERKRAVVLSLSLRYRESVREGFRFVPAFTAVVPGKLPPGLIGIASSRVGNTVTMFSKVDGRVSAVIPTGMSPGGVAFDASRRRAYVALSGEDAVEVIDLLGAEVIDRLHLTAGDAPQELVLTPDGRTLLAANSGSNTVSVIDPDAMIETNRIPVGDGPHSILVDRSGRRGYVFNTISNSITVLDIPRGIVAGSVATESGPIRGQFSRNGDRIYVLQKDSPHLGVVDSSSLAVVTRIYVGTGGTALKVDPRTDLIYLARKGVDEIAVYDPFSLLPADVILAGAEAEYLTIDGEENTLFLLAPAEDRMKMIRLVGKDLWREVDLDKEPYWVTLAGER